MGNFKKKDDRQQAENKKKKDLAEALRLNLLRRKKQLDKNAQNPKK